MRSVLIALMGLALTGAVEAQSAFDITGSEEMVEQFEQASRSMSVLLTGTAYRLVAGLFLLELIVWGFSLIKGRFRVEGAGVLLVQKFLVAFGLIFAVAVWALSSNDFFSGRMILGSFEELGLRISGLPGLDVTSVLSEGMVVGFRMFMAVLDGAPLLGHPLAGMLFVTPIVVVMVAYGVLGIAALYQIARAKLALGIGVLFVAFGASRFTVELTSGYLRFLFSSGVRILVIYYVLGLWELTAGIWIDDVNEALANFDPITFIAVAFNGVVWTLFFAVIAVKLPAQFAREVVSFQLDLGLRQGITAES